MKDKTILAIMQVAIGNANVKFSFFITMSPGSFPKGGLIFKSVKTPIKIAIIPAAINNFAI